MHSIALCMQKQNLCKSQPTKLKAKIYFVIFNCICQPHKNLIVRYGVNWRLLPLLIVVAYKSWKCFQGVFSMRTCNFLRQLFFLNLIFPLQSNGCGEFFNVRDRSISRNRLHSEHIRKITRFSRLRIIAIQLQSSAKKEEH